jgi:hypothetical protein
MFALAAMAFGSSPAAAAKKGGVAGPTPREVRAKAEKHIDDWTAIPLNAAQEQVKARALKAIPAPCCSEYTMLTCCCPCNLAKSVWGLSHDLIAKRGYTSAQVKREVLLWLEFVNPAGFTGNACFKGGCGRQFSRNGCGGMESTELIVGDDVR